MVKKAKAKAKTGSMPVSRNEEPGVLAPQLSNSSCVLPIKKRLSSMFHSHAPIRPDHSFSTENGSKTKDSGVGQISTLNSHDSKGKSDTPNNSLVEVKEERPLGAKVDSQPTMVSFLSISPETNPNTTSAPSRNVDNLVKPALTQKLASQEDKSTKVVTAKQGESHSKLELSLGPKKPHVSSLVDPNAEGSGLMRGAVNPSLLSLSLNKGKDISQEGSCMNGLNNNDVDDAARVNRSNWDLNTPMDSWEGYGDVVRVLDASEIDLLRKTSSSLDIKPPISSVSVIGSNGDQGKQAVGASEQENLVLNRNMNSPTVESEPVVETLIQANPGTVVRPGGTFEANVVESEVVKQNVQSIELSTDGPPELLEQNPMKCEEPLQEISMTSDVIAHQAVGRVLQLQESCSSSSTLPMPLSGGDLYTPFDQENAAIDAKYENFDLKESNVSSDKVEASVSANMNVEDHTVYKRTQDTDNLVSIGEESANNEEKVSLSAGTEKVSLSACTEKECDGLDHAFTGHVDTESVGCVREDDEYEDGEIREPMMQSIVEGMNSVHTESHDDFVKRCDEKAEKMNLLRPLLDKEKNIGDNVTFSSNYRPVRSWSVSSRSGREMYSYMEEKFYLPRNRDVIYGYGPKFPRDRFQDRSFGSSRGNFMRGRGRGSDRFHRLGRDWYSGRDFECYGGVADYRFRHKRIAPWIDGARRKPLNGHQQSMYNGPDGHFFQGNTKFTAMQRRGFPQMWSESPVRSHTWSSPHRRLTEGFNGHRDSSQHREVRIRSSPQTSFTEEAIAPQRRESPSYTAHDVDAVQEHVHPRSLSSRRSPPDPVLTSTNRSVEILDHRERADLHNSESTDETRMYGERQGGGRQMRNAEEQEDEFDVSKLKKRRF